MAVLADQTFREDFQRLPKPPNDPKARAWSFRLRVTRLRALRVKGTTPGAGTGQRVRRGYGGRQAIGISRPGQFCSVAPGAYRLHRGLQRVLVAEEIRTPPFGEISWPMSGKDFHSRISRRTFQRKFRPICCPRVGAPSDCTTWILPLNLRGPTGSNGSIRAKGA